VQCVNGIQDVDSNEYSPGSKVIVSNSTFSVRLRPEKSRLDSRSFFICFLFISSTLNESFI